MSRKRYIVNTFINLSIALVFLTNQLYAIPSLIHRTTRKGCELKEIYRLDYLSPKSSSPTRSTTRHLRVLIAGAMSDVTEVAHTWNPVKIGKHTEIIPDNIRQKGTLPDSTLPRLNEALTIIKERSNNKDFKEFFNMDVHPKKGYLGRWFSQRYLLQNLVFFEGPFLADMVPGNDNSPQTSMLNLILFSDLVQSIETLVFVLRHEMDHANPLTERQVKDRDLLYFKALPESIQDEIIDDLGRIEKAVKVASDSILAGAYKERTGTSAIEELQRYREVLYLAKREPSPCAQGRGKGLSARSKDALREYLGMKRNTAESFDGVPISYTVGGNLDSPVTLLFLHGWMSQSKDWRRQILEFENEYKIVTVDMRGFGESGQGNYSKEHLPHINDWVLDIKAVIEKEGLENIVILGHSMGGMVGFNLYLDHDVQDKIVGFIPIATSAEEPGRSFINAFLSNLVVKLRPVFKSTLPILTKPKAVALLDWVQKRILRNNSRLEALARIPGHYVGLTPHDKKGWHHLWTSCVGETNIRDWVIGYLAMSTHDVIDRLKDINIPVLWITGQKDKIVDPTVQEEQAKKIPDAELQVFDESGHFAHWDESERANSVIREFLEHKIEPVMATSATRVKKWKGELIANIGSNWSRYSDEWEGVVKYKDKFKRAVEEILASGEFSEKDIELIQRITLVSGNDKLARCNRARGQIVLDIRSFKNKDVFRLELIHELYHIKLAYLNRMGRIGRINPLVEEMFVIINQVLGFLSLSTRSQKRYLDALREDTDLSEEGLYQILVKLRTEEITDIEELYPMISNLLLIPVAFRFKGKDIDEFEGLEPGKRNEKLHELTNTLMVEEEIEGTGCFKAITTWQEIDSYIQDLINAGKKPEHVLVDLDMTVFAPRAYLGSNAWFTKRKKEVGVYRALWEWGDNERLMEKYGFYRLVDPQIPEIIEKWRGQGIEVVGFTARQQIKDSHRTQNILRKLGVKFSSVKSIPGVYYHEGVIYTFGSGENKARVLRKLSKGIGTGTTVLIDDSPPNIVNVLRDRELQNVHGLLYRSSVLDELLQPNADDYIKLAEEAIEGGVFGFAVLYCLNAVEQARTIYLPRDEKRSFIKTVWRIVARLNDEGIDTEYLTRFIINYDDTKCDLKIMDEGLKDIYLDLLKSRLPITDPEKTRVVYCKIDNDTDLDILKQTLRMVKEARRQNRYPKFRTVLTSDEPVSKIRRKLREAGLDKENDYDFWFAPKEGRSLSDFLQKSKRKDLVSITESDIITVDATDQSVSFPQVIYEEIAKREGYTKPVVRDFGIIGFSGVYLADLREEAKRKIEFLKKHKKGEPIVLFYHTDSDGIAAAAAETRFLKEYFGSNIDITYIPVSYSEPLPQHKIPEDAMWIVVDFDYEEFSKKIRSAGLSKKEILFQDHHDEDDPAIPDDVVYISPKTLNATVNSGQYPAGVLTTVLNGEVLRQNRDLTSAALYLEKTNWIAALAIYGDYSSLTWTDYLSMYSLDNMGLDELSWRITTVITVNPEMINIPLRDIIDSREPTPRLSQAFEERADILYRYLLRVTGKIKDEPIIFYYLTEEDLAEGDISKPLADHIRNTLGPRLVVIGVEKKAGKKRALALHARSSSSKIDAGKLMKSVSKRGGGHTEAAGARIDLDESEEAKGRFREVQGQIIRRFSSEEGARSSATRVRGKPGGDSVIFDVRYSWPRFSDVWPDVSYKNKFRKALKKIIASEMFRREDIELIRRITLVSGNDKLASCDRREGQLILDVRSFANQDVLRLELIHELWHIKLSDLMKRGKLGRVNTLIEEMFTILNQIQEFLVLQDKEKEAYLGALAKDTDESEKGLCQILRKAKERNIRDIRNYYPKGACYLDLRKLLLTRKAFEFSSEDITEFRKMLPQEIEETVNSLFEMKDALKLMGEPPDEFAGVEVERYRETRREIRSVIRLKGKGRVPYGSEHLAQITMRADGFFKESKWNKKSRRFTTKHLKFLQQTFQEVSFKLKKRFMQIDVEEFKIFEDMEVVVVQDSDHLIYYKEEKGKKKMFIDRRAFDSKELLLVELERIIGETLMRTMAGSLPPARIEVVYTLYLSVERFLKFSKSKQKEMLTVLKKKFPENPSFRELLTRVQGKDISKKGQWNEVIDGIVPFILEVGVYPEEVQDALYALNIKDIRNHVWNWTQLIESQIQIELAFRSHDPQMRNLAIGHLVKNAKKLRLEEIPLNTARKTVSLGATKFKLGSAITRFDSSIRCLRSDLYPDRLILVNKRGKFLLVEKLVSVNGQPYLRISNRSYKLESDDAVVDLSNILKEPKFWIGNYSLVDFWGNRFTQLLNRLRGPPRSSGLTQEAIPKDIAYLTRRIVSPEIRNDALKYLKKYPLPKTLKAIQKIPELNKLLLSIHHYLTLMSTGDVDDFVFAQEKVAMLIKDKRIGDLVKELLERLGISKEFDILSGLNEAQFAAVTAPNNPTIVIAGAGTGKTRVIVRRLAHVLNTEKDTKPENILAITFTKKAATEIAERVEDMVGTMRERIQISTFHSFGYRLLQEHGYLIGLPRNIRVLDEVEQWQFFRTLLPKLRKPSGGVLKSYWKRQNPSAVISGFISFINQAKDNLVSPSELMEYARERGDRELIEAAQVYRIYQEELLEHGYMDYGDLISYPVQLLEKRPEIKEHYQEQFKHILVDEFQDTNYAQIRLLKLLGKNVFAVGDDDQSIYQFRGASDASFNLFYKMYPDVKRFKLTQNYRSQPNIIGSANTLISNNVNRFDSQKNLWTAKQKGEPVEAWVSPDFRDEAVALADEIQKIYEKTGDYSQTAVLYRAHRYNRELISVLESRGIPYKVKGGIPLLNRGEIRDLIAYMKFINDPTDMVSFFRILHTPRFKVSDNEWIKLAEFMEKKQCSPWDMLAQLNSIRGISLGVKTKLRTLKEYLTELMEISLGENVGTVFNMLWEGYLEDLAVGGAGEVANAYIRKSNDFIEAYLEINKDKPGLADFLTYFNTYSLAGGDPEREVQEEKSVNAVQLMTVHSAKGLEFPYVFLINLTDRRFPTSHRGKPVPFPVALSKDKIKDDLVLAHYEEERRTMYVGMTRAQEKLYLCGVKKPYHKLSRFIKEILLLGERKDVLIKRTIPKAEEPDTEETVSAAPFLEHEIFGLRGQLLEAVLKLREVDISARYGSKGWSKNLLEVLHLCLDIANKSLVMEHTDPKEAQHKLKKLHDWVKGILGRGTDEAIKQAVAQDPSEILGTIHIAQPSGLKLPRPQKFSFTQIATYLDDPLRYKEYYAVGTPSFGPKSKALRFGSLIHELLESLNHSIEKGEPIKLNELKQVLRKRLDQSFSNLKKKEFKEYLKRGDRVLEMFYARDENFKSELLGIEREFELEVGGETIGGFIDCMRRTPDGKIQIIDYKTGSSKEGFGDKSRPFFSDSQQATGFSEKGRDKYKLQLLIYALWAHSELGYEPEDMELVNYYVEEDKYIIYSLTQEEVDEDCLSVRKITREDYAWAQGKAREVIDKIKEEVYEEKIAKEEELLQDEFLEQYRKQCITELNGTLSKIPKDDFLGKALTYIRLGRLSDQVNEPDDAKRYFRLGLKWLAKVAATQVPAAAPSDIKPLKQKRITLGKLNIDLNGLDSGIRVARINKNKHSLCKGKKALPIEKIASRNRSKEYLRIGNKVYEVVPGTRTINLADVIAQPKYWNSGLVAFFGQSFLLGNRVSGPEAERPPPIRLLRELPKEVERQISSGLANESLRTQTFLAEWETTLENIIQDLDPPQMAAVTTTERPLLVLGAPGTGKSLVLLRRAAYILHSRKDLSPENLLVLTDSRNSVSEFREKLEPFVGKSKAKDVSMTTVRDITKDILKANYSLVDLPKGFQPTNRAHQRVVLRKLWSDLKIKYHKQWSKNPDIIDNLIDYFIKLQRELIFADHYIDYAEWSGSEQEKELARIYKAWEDAMIKQGVVGNEQMVSLAVKMLQENPEIRSSIKEKFKYLFVNKLQDLSFAEFALVELLTPEIQSEQTGNYKNICAVGDENMGVGDPRIDARRNFRLFLERFPGHSKPIILRQNYRSTKRILTTAKKMLDGVYDEFDQNSPLARSVSNSKVGEKVQIITATDEKEEARAIVEEIKQLYNEEPSSQRDFRKFAVLTKTISAQRYIVEALENENIPYACDAAESMFEREEVKDLLALIAVFSGEADDLSLTRFLRTSLPQISAVDVREIANFMRTHGVTLHEVLAEPKRLSLSKQAEQGLKELNESFVKLYAYIDDIDSFLDEWVNQTGIFEELRRMNTLEADIKRMNLGKFVKFARRYKQRYPEERGISDFWDYLKMYRETGGDIKSAGLVGEPHGVYIDTIKRARDKGFETVFISGVTAGRFPTIPRRDMFSIPSELLQGKLLPPEYSFLEEARLLYLGMTKARKRLYLTGQKRDGLSKFLRLILEEAPKDTKYHEITPSNKRPVLSRYQRLYMAYTDQLIQHIDALSRAKRKGECNRAWQGIVNTVWSLARLQATQEAVLNEEDVPERVESVDKILTRTLKGRLPGTLNRELTQAKRKDCLEWLRFPERFIEQLPVPKDFRLSHSRIEKYNECPYAYRLKYVFKLPEEKTAALTFGGLMHRVLEQAYNKMNEGEKPTLSELMAFYEDNWSSEGYEDQVQESDYKKLGADIIVTYYNKNIADLSELPKTLVEKKFLIEIGGVKVLGFIDLIDIAESIVSDFKTGKAKTQKDADKSLQLTIYAYAYQDMTGELPEAVEFYNLVKNYSVSSKRSEKDITKLQETVRDAGANIQAEVFPPKEGHHCNWCPYKGICPEHEATGGKVGTNKPNQSSKAGNSGKKPPPGDLGSDISLPQTIAEKATSLFLDTVRSETIEIRHRKTILVWDTSIKNSQSAMGLLTQLERTNLGDNIYFVKGKTENLKKRINALKRQKDIGDDVDIVVVTGTGNEANLYRDLGEQDVYIVAVNDKNVDPSCYLPVLELLSLAIKIVFKDNYHAIKKLYEEITKTKLAAGELEKLRKGTLSILLPPVDSIDLKDIRKIYKLEREMLASA